MVNAGEKEKQGQPTVWGAEEIEQSQKAFLRLHQTSQVNLFMSKLVNLGFVAIMITLLIVNCRVARTNGTLKPMAVRINDVGRAEAIRLDEDWIPEEKDLRDAIGRFVERLFTRNGFETPKAVELNGLYLIGDGYAKWRRSVLEDLKRVAQGENLCRVRILRIDIESPSKAKTRQGTIANVRYATDGTSLSGAVIPNTSQGWETIINFRVGDYPQNITGRDAVQIKEQWLTRNPLGLRVMDFRVTRYVGADVADRSLDVVINQATANVKEEDRRERSRTGTIDFSDSY